MARTVKWGVIGCGGIARRRTIPEGIISSEKAELSLVYDPIEAVNAEVAKEFGTKAAGSEGELLASDVDAVYIASPASVHCGQVLAAAGAGKHVLCEKPLGMTVEEAEEILDACQAAGVTLGTGFMMRFLAQHQAALAMIREGRLGKLSYGRAQLSCWYPPMEDAWRQVPEQGGGGSLIDMGGHCIDLLEMFFGKLVRVSCFTGNIVHDYKSEDGAVASLVFENGALATVDTFFCVPDSSSKNVLELYGSQGSILAKNTIGQGDRGEMVAFLEEAGAGYDAQQAREAEGGQVIDPTPRNTYEAEITEFSEAVLENREPANSAALGLQSQKVLAACYESAQTGRAVEVG